MAFPVVDAPSDEPLCRRYKQIIKMQMVVVVVGGFVVVVVAGGFVVVVVGGGLVVVVVAGGLVVVVVAEGFVVVGSGAFVVVVEGTVVDVEPDGSVVVADDGGCDEDEVVTVELDAVDVVVGEKVDVVPGLPVVAAKVVEVVVDALALPLESFEASEVDADPTGASGRACINANPPAAVVPIAIDPATRATCEPATTTFPRLLN